ncbi:MULTISPECIES: alpha/beta hydrolase fold domain-containing protein [Frankia]|uniref:Esterase n=2 Tax=Frankia TaxID=1854 RepID=Q0RU30_FRAAA|nr:MULTISPECIES: alpha/beta hydrolase fold domain-containing protein [Frankia]CAJ58914.1 Putative esterase [Frankia alni ACN14a]
MSSSAPRPGTLDPELATVADALTSGGPDVFTRVREQAQAELAEQLARAELPPVEAVDLSAPADPAVPVRLFRPQRRPSSLPVFLWIHGGGFTAGSAEALDPFCAEIASRLDIAVANIEYRLAPGTPFPGPLHDCYAALRYVYHAARSLGLDENRIAIGGASSGAALAAGTALLARDRREVPLVFQLLDVPLLDDRLSTESMAQFVDTPGFTRAGAAAAWTAYLGPDQRPGDPDVSPYAAATRATDLRGLPSTYLSTMELDPARDEGILYALRLLAARVSVEVHSFPGTFHGAEIFAPGAAVSRRAAEERLRALARGLSVDADRRVRLT